MLVVLSISPAITSADSNQPPLPAVGDEPGFIFSEVTPTQLAVLVVGVGSPANTGLLSAFGVIEAGEDRRLQLWTIEDPYQNTSFKVPYGVSQLVLSGSGLALGQPALIPPMDLLLWFALGDSRKLDFWTLIDTTTVRAIDPLLLDQVRDEQPIPQPNQFGLELDAWFTTMLLAAQTDVKAFEDAANPDLTYSQLWQRPRRYRGQVVTMEGRLRQLDRIESPLLIRQAGFPVIYEGWLFLKNHADNPVCLLFTEVPPTMKPGKGLDYSIRFSGYFFKKYRYPDVSRKDRIAPLLIGRMPVLTQTRTGENPEEPTWAHQLLPLFLSLLGLTIVSALVFTLWFRHHDNKIRDRIRKIRNQQLVLPGPIPEPIFFPSEETKRVIEATKEYTDSQALDEK